MEFVVCSVLNELFLFFYFNQNSLKNKKYVSVKSVNDVINLKNFKFKYYVVTKKKLI